MTVVVRPQAEVRLPSLAPYAADQPPTKRAAYSDRTAALMAAVCELTYVAPALRSRVEAVLAGGGFRLAAVTGRTLFVVSPHLAVLAWRGTNSLSDWRLDLSARRVPLPGSPGLRVHEGFLAGFEQDRPAVEAAIVAYLPPDVPLYIAGHSLGGALAQLAAAALDSDALAACYTFGSPRVGTQAFDRLVHTPHYRVINDRDLVPGVPAPFVRGYRHSGDPRLILPPLPAKDGRPRVPPEVERRDRTPLNRFAVDLAASLRAAVTRRLPAVEDHMIWNYRARLNEIAAVRAPDHAAPAA